MNQTIQFDLPIHQEIAKLDNIFVTHSSMDQAIRGIAECISWSAQSREPKGAILTGQGGAGKTTICNLILKGLPVQELKTDDLCVRTVPAFYTSVPAPSTIKSLASAMLEQLNDPSPDKGTTPQVTKRLYKLLKQCKTRVILLDEFHNLLPSSQSTDTKTMVKICKWLKGFIDATKVMVCLVGTPECEKVVEHDVTGQLPRRFPFRFPLEDFSCGTEARPGNFVGFAKTLINQYFLELKLEGGLNLDDFEGYLQFWAATRGRPAYITLLLQTAISIALKSGNRRILTREDLAEAFDLGITREVAKVKRNPFRMSAAKISQSVLASVH